MKDEIHDKQIAYLLDRISQLHKRNGWQDQRIAYLKDRFNRLFEGNVQQSNKGRMILVNTVDSVCF